VLDVVHGMVVVDILLWHVVEAEISVTGEGVSDQIFSAKHDAITADCCGIFR
jgi:hypothetical protein